MERSLSGRGLQVPERAHGPLAVLGLVVLVGALFPDAWLRDGVFFQRDILTYWYPHIEVFVRVIAEGTWPLWNPLVTFGAPLLADPNLQLAYPPTWLNLVLLPTTYFKIFVGLHCVGAGLGAWMLARRIGLAPLSSFLAASAWTASGPLLSSVSLFHHFASAAWIPWVLWALAEALHRRTPGSALLLGAVAAGQLLAGSADVAFMTALLAGGAAAAWVLLGPERRAPLEAGLEAPARERLRTAGWLIPLAVGFAVLLAAVQWWPTLAHVATGSRLDSDPRSNMYWSLHPASMADLLVPRLVADWPVGEAARQALFEGREPLLASLYLGVPCFALVALALLGARRRAAWLVAAGLVFFVLAALGRHAPLLPSLLELPVFGLFRYPLKYLLPAALLWAVLSGLGLETFTRAGSRSRGVLIVSLGMGALAVGALGLAGWLGRHPTELVPVLDPGADGHAAAAVASGKLWTVSALALGSGLLLLLRWRREEPRSWHTLALVALSVGTLAAAGRPVNALAPPELLRYRPAVVDAMEKTDAPPRVHAVSYPLDWLRRQRERSSESARPDLQAALGTLQRLRPPTGARWGVAGSYDGSFTGLAPPALSLLSVAAQQGRESPLLVRLLRLGSVDYVVALEDLPLPGLTEVGRFDSVYAEPVRLLRVDRPLPRAYVVDRVRSAPGPEALGELMAPGFDPERDVVLVEPDSPHRPALDFRGTVRLVRRRADRIELEVTASAPGYVVVTQAWDPGWRASVDGNLAELLNANLLFCGVRIPAGPHRVQLLYRPPSAAWGAAATVLAIVLGLGWWGSARRRRAASG